MRTILVTLAAAALIAPAAYAAKPSAVTPTPAQACKALKTTMGAQFASTYKSLGACVAQKSQQAATNAQNAAKQCKAELAMTEAAFTAAHAGKTFAQTYGVNVNNKNAYGKCVSARASAAAAQQLTAELSAAKKCKAMLTDASFAAAHGGKSFKEFFGTGKQKTNAFGRCVAQLAKAAAS
jgi:hypothetical protein